MSEITLAHMLKHVDDVILVSDSDTASAARFFLRRMKICVEPSGAIGAAVLMNKNNLEKYFKNCENIVIFVCGGNFDYLLQADLINDL